MHLTNRYDIIYLEKHDWVITDHIQSTEDMKTDYPHL